MIISLGFYKRRPDLSWEQFSDHWRDVHGPLLRDTPETAQHIRRYVQHHLRPYPGAASGLGFDGFSEVWFDDIQAREAMHSHPEVLANVKPDLQEFLDVSVMRTLVLDEQAYIIGPAPETTDGAR